MGFQILEVWYIYRAYFVVFVNKELLHLDSSFNSQIREFMRLKNVKNIKFGLILYFYDSVFYDCPWVDD